MSTLKPYHCIVFRFKFRPVNDNPYLHLPDEEEEEEDIEMNQMYVLLPACLSVSLSIHIFIYLFFYPSISDVLMFGQKKIRNFWV